LSPYKNIITWLIKIGIGLGSFALIYWRLQNDFTPETTAYLTSIFTSSSAYILLFFSLLLIPLNWGIESYKWQLVTKPVERISLIDSMRSVYSGICVGNLAPARATEFLAKILFFKIENRPTITLLHFANGTFQLFTTIIIGVIALGYKLKNQAAPDHLVLIGLACALLVTGIALFIFYFHKVQAWFVKRFESKIQGEVIPYRFGKRLILKLLFLSALRYVIFVIQFLLIIKLFYTGEVTFMLLASVSIYFLLTTALPMYSVVEAAIRAAIALLVFGGLPVSETSLVLAAVLLWIINIVIPSIAGYVIIVRKNFGLSLFKRQ